TAFDETGQTLTFVVGVSGVTGSLAFDSAPSLNSASGELMYTAAAITSGSATINVVLQDSGSGTAPNINQSSQQQFTIVVNPVNEPPHFWLYAASTSSNEDAGPVTVSGFATSIAPGPATAFDETGQTLTFVVGVSGVTGSLAFDSAPAINSATGALTYTAAANANGSATSNVVLQDSGSGTAPNINQSSQQQFTIVVNPVNDPPSFSL